MRENKLNFFPSVTLSPVDSVFDTLKQGGHFFKNLHIFQTFKTFKNK